MSQTRFTSLNATTWWLLGASIALDASLVTSPWILLVLTATSFTAMLYFAPDEKRAPALKLYGFLSASVLVIRLIFRVIFNQPDYLEEIAIDLPALNISGAGFSFSLFGPVSWKSLNLALVDGLRLAAIIMGFALANTVANPRKLLRSTPSALYEVATAAAVAINLAPQFLLSLRRVRRARELRGHARGLKSFTGIVVPLLEDTVQRSLDLAASMDARGFGRKGDQRPLLANIARMASMAGLVSLSFAVYLLLATDSPVWVPLVLVLGTLLAFTLTVRLANRQSVRTRLKLEKRTWRDAGVIIISSIILLLLAASHVPILGHLGWLK